MRANSSAVDHAISVVGAQSCCARRSCGALGRSKTALLHRTQIIARTAAERVSGSFSRIFETLTRSAAVHTSRSATGLPFSIEPANSR